MRTRIATICAALSISVLAVGTAQADYGVYVTKKDSGASDVAIISSTSHEAVHSHRLGDHGNADIVVTPDQRQAYVLSLADRWVRAIDISANTAGPPIAVGSTTRELALSPDGSRLYVVSWYDKKISVIGTATGTPIAPDIVIGEYLEGAVMSPDGARLYVPHGFGSHRVSAVDTAANDVVATVDIPAQPTGPIVVTPDGSRLYVAHYSGVSAIDTATGTVTDTGIPVIRSEGLAISLDGSHLYVTDAAHNRMLVASTATHAITGSVAIYRFPTAVEMSPDGRRVYVAAQGADKVVAIDAATNAIVAETPVGCCFPNAIAFGPAPVAATPQPPSSRPTAPSIVGGPHGRTHSRTARLRFTGPAGAAFQCRLEGRRVGKALRPWRPCRSPQGYRRLKPGGKRFSVRAVAGDRASVPARRSWTIVRKRAKRGPKPLVLPTTRRAAIFRGVCPSSSRCSARVSIKAGKRVLARGRYSIPARRSRKVKIRLTRAGRDALSKRRRIRARATLTDIRTRTRKTIPVVLRAR